MTFKLTPAQEQLTRVLGSDATHIMAYGGSRSGKTFHLVRAVLIRALKEPKSRHTVLRYRFNHVKASVIMDTLPKVMDLCFPGVSAHCHLDKTDWYYTLPNRSEVWFGGLDDKERTEKILGQEYATIYLNECSQIPWASRNIAMTRLAQKTALKLKAYYDCVSGDTVLDGHTKSIAELAKEGRPIRVLTTHGWRIASAPWLNGFGALYRVVTSSGRVLRVTASHRFWTPVGWRRLDEITIGQKILCLDAGPSHDAGLGVPSPIGKVQGWLESCCRYLHRHGGRFLRDAKGALACLASSFDAEARSLCLCLHGGSDCHRGHHERHVAQHSRHSQSCREPLSQASAWSIGHMERCGEAPACGLSRQIRQFDRQSLEVESRSGSVPGDCVPAPWRLKLSSCWAAVADGVAIGRQWLRYSLLRRQSLGLTALAATEAGAGLLALDAPLFSSNASYETVVKKSFSTTDAFYTVHAPGCNHYVASGLVSHNCNPPGMAHWTYRLFREKRDPDTRTALRNPENYSAMQMNPRDNMANLDAAYIAELEGMNARMRQRFLLGQFADASESALWSLELLDQQRILDGELPDMQRVIIAVDPSGCSGEEDERSDEVGIVVVGLGRDGRAYVLEDLSGKYAPNRWGALVASAFERHEADCVVAETNFGGAMVKEIIRAARPGTPFREVKASRGKIVRAEPIAALFEQQKVSLVGHFDMLEDQLCSMTTAGYTGGRSPDRCDAMVWGLTELFPAVTRREAGQERGIVVNLGFSRMKGHH